MEFQRRAGACSGSGPCVVAMDSSKTVTAGFTQQPTLIVAKSGSGTVTSSPAGIDCGLTCSGQFEKNTVVTLTATPGANSAFNGWSGSGCSTTGPCSLIIDANKTVTATFTGQETLTLGTSGPGIGTVASSRPGINCGPACGAQFDSNTVVTLTAVAGANSLFAGWSGAGCSGTGLCSVTMNAAKSVTVNFTQIPYTLYVSASPSNGGSVSGGGTYTTGTSVAVTATPNSGWSFSRWSGACTGFGSCVVIMDSSKTVTANFTQIQYTLTVSANPSNGGSVSGGGTYAQGAQVTVTPAPSAGWSFSTWAGACSGSGSCVVIMDFIKMVIANFTQIQYTLTVSANPSNGGSVSGGGAYNSGTSINVTATPSSGWSFTSWSGACTGSGSCVVTMDASKTVTANFAQIQYTLTVSASPSNGGSVTGGGAYNSGSSVNVTAIPNSGWSFTGWSGACTGSGSCVVTMDSTKAVAANFTQIPAPSAGRISFVSTRDGNGEIYIMSEDGSNETRLTDDPCYDARPSLSPDGTKIGFTRSSCPGGGTQQIWVMNSDGTGQVNLTNNGLENGGPDWSLDGAKIAYHAANTIWVMNSDGSGQTQLISEQGNSPAWSNDGTKLVFWSNRDGASNQEIYVMDSDGSNQVNISNAGGNDVTPQWSPVGTKIVFRSSRFGGSEIMTMDPDGSNQTRLTTNGDGNDPAWSPDGTKIVYAEAPPV